MFWFCSPGMLFFCLIPSYHVQTLHTTITTELLCLLLCHTWSRLSLFWTVNELPTHVRKVETFPNISALELTFLFK